MGSFEQSVVDVWNRGGSDAPPRIVPLSGLDPDQLVGVIRGGQFDHCQLDSGPLTGEVARIPLGSAHVDAGHYSKTLVLRGAFPAAQPTILLIRDTAPGFVMNAIPVRRGDILLCSGGARIDALVPGSSRWMAVQLEDSSEDAPKTPPGQEVTCFRPSEAAGSAAFRCADGLLDTARNTPDLLRPARARERMAGDLTSALRAGLDSGVPVVAENGRALDRRREVVRAACAYMMGRLEQIVRAPRLCQVAGVSLRTLDYAFKQILGVAPMTYYRAQRFAAARRALLRPVSHACTVTSAATRFGFYHLGRFSVEYRARFHECPSVTLARSTGISAA